VNPAMSDPCSVEAFEGLYQKAEDPWNFADSEYEQLRYFATLDTLRKANYRSAFEPGCSIGALTARLAERCDQVLATDFAPTAVAQARARCAPLANVRIEVADIALDIPRGPFDLIVLSEIGYYFGGEQLADIAQALAAELEPGGEFVAVHWLGESADHRMHGDEVHAILRTQLPLTWRAGFRHSQFRLDSWEAA
jgi:SAM-dependent methyltransferase